MINVADNDGQQTETKHESRDVDDWVKRLKVVQGELCPSQILLKKIIKLNFY